MERGGPGRVGIDRTRAAVAISIAILVTVYLAYRAQRAARAWLADQADYQLDFRAVELDPPPPSWFRGGSNGFVEDVARRSGMPERIALLKLRDDELTHAFEHSPWTEEVIRVSYRPLGATVSLRYRRPVALVEISTRERYLVDESAVILPADDVAPNLDDFARQELLITIKGEGLAPPRDPKPGIPWKPLAGVPEVAPGNGQIAAAAELASFLQGKLRHVDRVRHPALNFVSVNPMDDDHNYRGLFLWNPTEKIYVLWGPAPGQEKPPSLSAEEKWRRICDWGEVETPRTLPDGRFWRIVGSGLIEDGKPRPPKAARRIEQRRRDAGTILTKGSGQSP